MKGIRLADPVFRIYRVRRRTKPSKPRPASNNVAVAGSGTAEIAARLGTFTACPSVIAATLFAQSPASVRTTSNAVSSPGITLGVKKLNRTTSPSALRLKRVGATLAALSRKLMSVVEPKNELRLIWLAESVAVELTVNRYVKVSPCSGLDASLENTVEVSVPAKTSDVTLIANSKFRLSTVTGGAIRMFYRVRASY